ncbi:hypothetical protein Godav_023986 [Gossypium davidsonii]|uniref:MATH domain-containing protein n=1 Tax=Gossypium davidsonii TaxID=34287 RepID=A0A7J8SV50_GOSDV|nr:hypothetical protein [Gossypium davidsonii]
MDVNGLITKVTWRVEILSAVHSLSKSLGVNGQITKVTWRIENFSSIKGPRLYSENFSVDGHKWRLVIFPKGNDVVNLFRCCLRDGVHMSKLDWQSSTDSIVNFPLRKRHSLLAVSTVEFTANDSSWGFPSLLALSELHDPKRGYLVNDVCLLEAYVSTDTTKGLISHELMIKTDSDRQKTDEADSSTQSSEESVAFEPEDPTEEDMNTFFTSLENELLGMEESLKELVSQAAKAMQDKNHLLAKESMKLTITRDLDRNLIRYKEIESEFAALLAERMGIFRTCQKMKKELEALGKELEECESKAKVAEEEEKSVEAEWGRIKGFISSIKGKM